MSSAPVLLAFLSTYKSPRRSASRGRLHPCLINFFSSLSLYISPPSPPALVINWVSPSLYQYCLTFCFLFSFYLVSLALPLSSFIPYPSFPLFISSLSLCRAVHSWSWRHTMSQSCQLASTAPLRTCQRWMGWWWAIRSSATPQRPRRCPG